MILKLENTTTHQIYEYEVKDMNNGEKLYFRFDIDTSDLVDGEYILSLYDGEKLVANDLLKIGDYNPSTIQYKKGENTYINVTLDNSVQGSKSVVIETTYTTITPDDGFNSMGKVDVNAQPLYDNAYHIGHTEGYNEGLESSYQVGYDDGKAAQKALLEPITITENGTYTKEDGYNSIEVNVPDLNGSYDEGYSDGYLMGEDKGYDKGYEEGIAEGTSNAGEIIAETARVLDITENGTYFSRFSEPPFEKTGDNFFNYTHLTNVSYDTGVVIDKNSVIEFWIKPYDFIMSTVRAVFGLTQEWRIYTDYADYKVYVGDVYGFYVYVGNLNLNEWNHIVFDFAKNEGLFNGEKITNVYYEHRLPEGKTLVINGDKYNNSPFNGYFGMIKINDIVFIPTENGFLNTTTGEYLQKRSEGEYEYFAPVMPSGNLIKTVNVNVAPSIKFAEYGMKCSYSSFKTLPSWVDLNGMTDYSYMFTDSNIEEVPYIDTSKATTLKRMYANCFNITSVPLYDVKNATDLTGMFSNAQNLQYIPNFELGTNVTIAEIAYGCNKITKFPQLDTSGVVNMQSLVYGCTSLTELPALDASNINVSTYNSASIIGYAELKNLTKAGGLIGLRRKMDDNYGWAKCPNLDYESCINILNGLFNFTGNGISPNSNEGKLKVHKNFLNLVGDEINIATAKGWSVSA